MHNLEHLFLVGEFPERAHLLSALSLEQVTLRPDGASHSIYEELWHLVGYQQSILSPGDPAGDFYPSAPPEHEHQWRDLVRVFLDGAHAAAALGQAPERLAVEVEPGVGGVGAAVSAGAPLTSSLASCGQAVRPSRANKMSA